MKSLITNAFKRDAIPWKSIYGPAPPISGKKHLKSHRSFHQTNDFLHFFLSLNMQQHRLPTLLSYDYLIIFYCNLPDILIFSSFLGHSSAFFFFFSPQPPHVDIHFWILRSPPPVSLSLQMLQYWSWLFGFLLQSSWESSQISPFSVAFWCHT